MNQFFLSSEVRVDMIEDLSVVCYPDMQRVYEMNDVELDTLWFSVFG